jgi:putative ABC transport system permease protein
VLSLLREISLRHWLRSRLRSLLVVLGIALGVALYVATEAAVDSMFAAFNDFVTRISGRADLTIEGSGLGVPGELLPSVSEIEGVAHAAASVEVSVQAVELGESLLVLGLDLLGDPHFLPFSVERGEQNAIEDPLSFVNDPTAILLSKRFALRHGLRQGSSLKLLTSDGPKDFHVRGVLEDSGVGASFGGQLALMYIDAAQVSFARGTYVDRIDVALGPGQDAERVRARLAARVGPELRVERPAQIGTRLRALTEPLQAALWVSGLLALGVGGFLVYNAVGVAIAQRKREVGILRALGVTRAGMIALFMAEAALLALPAIALGLALGVVLSRHSVDLTLDMLNESYASVAKVAPELRFSLVLKALAAGLSMALLSSFFPARRGSALDPAVLLRGAASFEPSPAPVAPMLLAAALVAGLIWLPPLQHGKAGGAIKLALIMLSGSLAAPAFIIALRAILVRPVELTLGVPGRLGLDYVERTLGRSTINVLSLMVAVGMSVSVGGWLSSFERSISEWAGQVGIADLTVTQGSPVLDRRHVPLADGATARVKAVAGVADIQRFRSLDLQRGELKLRLVATDTDIYRRYGAQRGKGWQLASGEPLREGELSGARSILLSENASRLLGVGAGQDLELTTPKGVVSFQVRAVIVDYTSETGSGFIDLRFYHEYWSDAVVDGLFVYLREHADPEQVASGIRAAMSGERGGASSTVYVLRASAFEQHVLDTLHRTFSYSRSVEWMTLVIALLGVVGTMIAAVIDRRREVSMLRAVGATRGQVAGAIIVEAGFLGLCAALAGVIIGMLECRVFFQTLLAVQTGWHLEFVFPWASALQTAGLVIVTSALSGAIPAWHAVREDIVSAPVGE